MYAGLNRVSTRVVTIEKTKARSTNLLRTTTQGMSIRDAASGPVCAPASSIHWSISTAAVSAAARKAAIFFLDLASTFQYIPMSLWSWFTFTVELVYFRSLKGNPSMHPHYSKINTVYVYRMSKQITLRNSKNIDIRFRGTGIDVHANRQHVCNFFGHPLLFSCNCQ